MTQMQVFNNFVLNFLSSYADEKMVDMWNKQDNQNQLQKLFVSKVVPVKTKKDPNKPKRGKSSYIFFCQAMRGTIKKERPDMSAKEITAELGARWNTIKDDKKKTAKYVKQAVEDKDRYAKEMKNYVPNEESKTKKKTGPKRAKSAYIFFCQEKRNKIKEANPKISAKEIIAELGAEWNKIKDDKKAIAKYTNLAEEDRSRYEQEKIR